MFDRGNGPTGSCIQRDRVVVCAESWPLFSSFWVGVCVVEGKKEGGRRGEEGERSSVVGVGVIVGDGAEKESVLRPDCLPSGEKLFQHPQKLEEKKSCAVLYDKSEHKFLWRWLKMGERLRHCHV